MSEKQEIYEWPNGGCCPFCGCTKYRRDEIVRKNSGKGGWIVTTQILECCSCTLHFGNAGKFNVKLKEPKKNDGVDSNNNSMDGFSSSTEGKREITLFAMPEGIGPDV